MTSLLPYITGSTGALAVLAIVCWLFYEGKLHSDAEFSKLEKENENLKAALDTERKAVDEQARVGSTTNALINALTTLATQKQAIREAADGLVAEDLGL